MAIPVARVHLKMAHAALPALLPTPPKLKMLPLVSTPPFVAHILPKPPAKPSRADSADRWDTRKTKPAGAEPSANARHGSFPRKNVTSPPPKPCRADFVERWDAHKKAASPATSSSSSSSATSVHKKRCPPQAEQLHDGESSSTSSNDIDDTGGEEILWKPRTMYAGPGFVVAAPQPSMIPVPTSFLVPVA